jgi:hypothetical protein
MPRITLDDFNQAVDTKFEDLEFDVSGGKVARFVQPLRLSPEKRDAFDALAGRFSENKFNDEDDLNKACLDLLEVTARSKTDFTNMKKHLGGDTSRILVAVELLIQAYGGWLGVGEA